MYPNCIRVMKPCDFRVQLLESPVGGVSAVVVKMVILICLNTLFPFLLS